VENATAPQRRSIKITGMDCADCATGLERRVGALPGVSEAKVNFATAKMTLQHEIPLDTIIKTIEDAGYGVEGEAATTAPKESVFRLSGLDCADCAAKLESTLAATEGIDSVSLNFGASKVTIVHSISAEAVMRIIGGTGHGAVLEQAGRTGQPADYRKTNYRIFTTIISGVLLISAWGLGKVVPPNASMAMYLAAALIGGFWTFRRGISSLRARTFDMNVMMTVAVVGAAAIGQWSEGASVAFLYSVSNLLESYTMEKTRKSIRSLMQMAPSEATVRRYGIEENVPVDEIQLGDTVIVRPGERIAVDGTVSVGQSSVDQAPITGESIPVERSVGDTVYAGTINQQGALEVTVTRLASDTTLSKIIHMVEEAQGQRAPSQVFVDRFASYYTPAILVLVAGMALLPPLLFSQPWVPWIYRALALVIVACPCALVISTPVAMIAAIGNAAKNGVLIKGGAYLEQMGSLRVVAFDKTGTLTKGNLEVTDIVPLADITREQLLSIASAIESRSEHPLAQAILRKADAEHVSVRVPTGFEALPGRGARADVDGKTFYIGNTGLLSDIGLDTSNAEARLDEFQQRGRTAVLVGTDTEILGLIAVADEIRPESASTIRDLHAAGVQKVVMLSGDNTETARSISAELGIEEFRAELLPEGKVTAVKDLLAQYSCVAMVGDGINDAPALATATVGIAMGVTGTDTALETADVALMSDGLARLPYAIRLSRKALRVIKQNIAFSILIKAIAVGLIFPGWLALWMAVLSDMGASVLVALNGLRLINGRSKERHK